MENKDLGSWQYMTLEPPPHIRELLERIEKGKELISKAMGVPVKRLGIYQNTTNSQKSWNTTLQ